MIMKECTWHDIELNELLSEISFSLSGTMMSGGTHGYPRGTSSDDRAVCKDHDKNSRIPS